VLLPFSIIAVLILCLHIVAFDEDKVHGFEAGFKSATISLPKDGGVRSPIVREGKCRSDVG
jgi:hypothetical protein